MASSFLDRVKGPVASCQVVRTLLLPIFEQVVADGGELERCTALEHEDGEVIRDCQELLQVASGLLGNGGEGLASMTHFHHGHACAIVVHEGVCCLLEDRLGQLKNKHVPEHQSKIKHVVAEEMSIDINRV